MTHLKIGRCVRIHAPRSAYHRHTGTVVYAHLDEAGAAVTVRVQIDGTDERIWLHRDAVRPLDEEAA